MFSIGKNMAISKKIHPPKEVLANFNRVTLGDIAAVSEMICDLDNYCGAAITNEQTDLKAMWEG
jgi:hypothetical protein